MPCYDLLLLTESTLGPAKRGNFGYSQLAWVDGRWVQVSRTYSSPHGWLAITSDSSFMRSSCRPQSELRLLLMGLAPPYGLATHCSSHCITCAAQNIKGSCWFGVILTFLLVILGSLLWHIKHRTRVAPVTALKRTPQGTSWRQPCNTCDSVLAGVPNFSGISLSCQVLVRFLAYYRIKPHAPPLVWVPVYSFEF